MTLEPIPDRLVVLTFDDASKSHFTVARPVLLKYKFGATFFVTEGWDFATNKRDYMTWEEIARLHKDGFEVGNHTKDHVGVTDKTVRDLIQDYIDALPASTSPSTVRGYLSVASTRFASVSPRPRRSARGLTAK
jgi:peptidoglycan/xylan/chitin deacetylase (PgdA/CDA1 family)